MNIKKSFAKYFLIVAVVVGSWGCSSTTNLQHANYEDDDVYFSRKDREKAKLAKETEIKNNPKVNTNSNGMDVNPTYGVTTTPANPTNVNPEYVDNGNSTITNNSNNYSGNEYYTEYRANRVQVPRDNYDSWGNANNGVFYDPYLNPASPFYDPYLVQSSVVPFSVRIGWGRGWRYRRWYNRYGYGGYDPYYRNDFWYRRNAWNYGGGFGYYNTNPWCPPNYVNRPIYTNTTNIASRPTRVINRGPRRNGAGRRGNVILTNATNTKRRAQNTLNNSGGRDLNKRAQTAGRRYKRRTTSDDNGKRVTGTTTNTRRSTTRSTRRSTNYNRSRRGSAFKRNSSSTPSFNRNFNTNRTRTRSSFNRSSNSRRSSYSRPSSRTTSRPKSSSKRSSGSKRKK